MEVKLGVTYSPKELVVETDQSPDDVASLVEEAVSGRSKVLWLSDAKGRRVDHRLGGSHVPDLD